MDPALRRGTAPERGVGRPRHADLVADSKPDGHIDRHRCARDPHTDRFRLLRERELDADARCSDRDVAAGRYRCAGEGVARPDGAVPESLRGCSWGGQGQCRAQQGEGGEKGACAALHPLPVRARERARECSRGEAVRREAGALSQPSVQSYIIV